jgi:hypothetical protein
MSDEARHEYRSDNRILSIVAAPAGWWALTRRDKDDGYDPTTGSIYDVAYVEPIAVFALMETVERLWKITPDPLPDYEEHERFEVEEPDEPEPTFPHTYVMPVPWHSGERSFLGADELDVLSTPDLIVHPPFDLTSPWVREFFQREL